MRSEAENRVRHARSDSARPADKGMSRAHPAARKSFLSHNLPITARRSSVTSSHGFTLVELLVVIAIIAVLLAIFIDTGQAGGAYVVPYFSPTWSTPGAYIPPIHHAGGVTFSFADAHAEHWKWSRETINLPRGFQTIFDRDGLVIEGLAGDGTPQTADGLHDLQRTQKAIWGRLGYAGDGTP